MIKLSVINFKKESRKKLKNIILIIFFSIIIFNLRIDFGEYKSLELVDSTDNVLEDKKRFNFEFEFDFKVLLEKCFMFFNKDIFLSEVNFENKELNNELNNELNRELKQKNKIDFLKDNICLLGYLNKVDEVINYNGIENLSNDKEIIVNTGDSKSKIEIEKEKENIVNELNLNKKDKELLYSNYVYTPKYEIPAKNTNDVFDIDLKNIPKIGNTKVIAEKNKVDKFNVQIGNVKIRNESKYDINENVLNFDFKLNNKKDIVIYHTHTCESYTASEKYNYVQTGNYRSTDLSYSVSRVGDVLEFYLKKLNYNVVHSSTYHDYPAYNGSYNRALTTVSNLLNNNSSEIVIDLHRDAIGNNSDYGPVIEINGERVAQLMIVMGTDGGGLKHDDWKKNLKFAVELQEKAEEMYPGFFKPIIVRNARYNQHVTDASVIIEVGATGNTLEEAEGAMKYLSVLLDEYIKEN